MPSPISHPTFRIAVGADHGALELKNAVVAHLKARGHEVQDFGSHSKKSVSYADYANLVARTVADGTYDYGILACTSGVGMCIAANRHHRVRVRAASIRSIEEAETTRQHNNSNVLCLSGKFTDADTAIAMADVFLTTAFEGGRHEARVCASSRSRIAVADPDIYAAINLFFPALRSGHRLSQWPSPQKQIPDDPGSSCPRITKIEGD